MKIGGSLAELSFLNLWDLQIDSIRIELNCGTSSWCWRIVGLGNLPHILTCSEVSESSVWVDVQSLRHVRLFETSCATAHQASLSFTISQSLLRLMPIELKMASNHLIPSPPSSPALKLSQHQDLLQWVGFSHQVVKVLELQLQHQSLQWIVRVDFL